MTELIIVSGKGGTGKTSLVGSLAALSRDKVLVDCDVDAADLHLILQHNVLRTTEFIGGKQASIIEDRCTNCGLCEEYCRFDAIKHESHADPAGEERYWIDKHACDGCAVCVRHCPEQAIDFKEIVAASGTFPKRRMGLLCMHVWALRRPIPASWFRCCANRQDCWRKREGWT